MNEERRCDVDVEVECGMWPLNSEIIYTAVSTMLPSIPVKHE